MHTLTNTTQHNTTHTLITVDPFASSTSTNKTLTMRLYSSPFFSSSHLSIFAVLLCTRVCLCVCLYSCIFHFPTWLTGKDVLNRTTTTSATPMSVKNQTENDENGGKDEWKIAYKRQKRIEWKSWKHQQQQETGTESAEAAMITMLPLKTENISTQLESQENN